MENPLLVDEATNGNHSQSSVHDFINLILLESGWFLAEAEGIEAEVSRGALSFNRGLESVTTEEFKNGDKEENLTHSSSCNVVVMGFDGQHLREV